MGKSLIILVLFFLAASTFSQQEIAMNINYDAKLPETGNDMPGLKAEVPFNAFRALSLMNPTPLNVMFGTASSFPSSIPLIPEPEFGADFTISSDTLTGHRLIDLNRQVTELMVFAKNEEGKLVMARLYHMVSKVELEFACEPGAYRIEMLTREGDKATLILQ